MATSAALELGRRDLLRTAGVVAATGALAAAGVGWTPAVAASLPLLRRGARGAAVVRLQRRLSALGYWVGAVDGVFGELTRQGVLAIQKVAGIVRDGVVGPVTWSRLDAGTRPAAHTRSGRVIEIDKPHQVLLVVDDGRVQAVYATSTGSEEPYYHQGRWWPARTTSGSYRIYRTYSPGWEHGSLGSLYRPMYFNGGIAIHGYGSVPAYPASHGCCRVTTGAMDRLWSTRQAAMGRRVLVY